MTVCAFGMTVCGRRLDLAYGLWEFEPHAKQRQFIESTAKVKVAACGRRWGKSLAAAVDVATFALCVPGSVQMIVSPTYDQSRLIFSHVERLLMGIGPLRRATHSVRTPYPLLEISGSTVMARTADDDGRNLRGHAADRVIVDEAAFVTEQTVKDVVGPMLADKDGEQVLVSTPCGRNYFYKMWALANQCTDGTMEAFQGRSVENPAISEAYVERQRTQMGPREFAVEYEAAFTDSRSNVFNWEEVERAKVIHPEADAWLKVGGLDLARYMDFTVITALGVDQERRQVIEQESFNSVSWTDQVERICSFIRRHRLVGIACDQTGVGDPLLEMLQNAVAAKKINCCIDGVVFNNANKREMIERLNVALNQGKIGLGTDRDLVAELNGYEYDIGETGLVRMGGRGMHDDRVISLALANHEARYYAPTLDIWGVGPRAPDEVW